jgi:hypothetical protein
LGSQLWGLGNFRIWFLGHGFQDLGSQLWGFLFFSRPKLPRTYYGFQDMVFGTWDLNFGAWEILGYGFQDMVFKAWDLNFGAWIFTLAVSKIET